jgi:hypothetical protein
MLYYLTIPSIPQFRQGNKYHLTFQNQDYYLDDPNIMFSAPNLKIARSYLEDSHLQSILKRVKLFGHVFLDTTKAIFNGPNQSTNRSSLKY